MKKIVFLILMLLLCGCQNKTYTEINYDKLYKKMNSYEDYILLIGKDNCEACKSFEKVIEKIAEEQKIKILYLNINLLKEEEKLLITSKYYTDSGQIYTPVLLIIEKGIVKQRQIGNKSYDETIKFLLDNGIMEE